MITKVNPQRELSTPVDNFLGWLESVWRSPLAGGRPPTNTKVRREREIAIPVDNFLLSRATYVCMGVGGSGSNSGVGIEHMFDLPSQRCDYCHISP